MVRSVTAWRTQGYEEGSVDSLASAVGRFRFSVFRLRPAKAGLRRTRRFSVVSSELGSMQASPYPKNVERGSFVSGISYN